MNEIVKKSFEWLKEKGYVEESKRRKEEKRLKWYWDNCCNEGWKKSSSEEELVRGLVECWLDDDC